MANQLYNQLRLARMYIFQVLWHNGKAMVLDIDFLFFPDPFWFLEQKSGHNILEGQFRHDVNCRFIDESGLTKMRLTLNRLRVVSRKDKISIERFMAARTALHAAGLLKSADIVFEFMAEPRARYELGYRRKRAKIKTASSGYVRPTVVLSPLLI